MNLIAYSDSEESDSETPQAPKPAVKTAPKSFQKVVDRSNPGKIKLNLPSTSQSRVERNEIEADAPPAKKARTGGGAFSGFNAMLPAPKKPKVDPATAGMAATGSRGAGKKLGVGVNLRTGAEPAFQRRTVIEEDYDEEGNPIHKEVAAPTQKNGNPLQKEDFRALLNLPPPKSESEKLPAVLPEVAEVVKPKAPIPQPEAKPASRPKFMPLSVTRGKKKKPAVPKSTVSETASPRPVFPSRSTAPTPVVEPKPAAKPKVSLFGVSQEEEAPSKSAADRQYQPLLYGFDEEDEDPPLPDDAFDSGIANSSVTPVAAASGAQGNSHNLTNIASELNLTEAERRQLFGRKGRGPDLSAANIIDFNTDREYAHNERLRQQGETVQHNVFKSISGTGKNSLKSLINVATTQKDALEDHFAAGKRNKREAGNKYGW